MAPYRMLFVCWGNICRSPTAQAIMQRRIDDAGLAGRIEVDSAGTSAEHDGEPPDHRAVVEAKARGLDLSRLRARKVKRHDWERYDLLLVADDLVERSLQRSAPLGADHTKVARITAFVEARDGELVPHDVPDPYYGGPDGFTAVFDLLERACDGLMAHARRRSRPSATP
jgi:protein-tyrosine phosphatase